MKRFCLELYIHRKKISTFYCDKNYNKFNFHVLLFSLILFHVCLCYALITSILLSFFFTFFERYFTFIFFHWNNLSDLYIVHETNNLALLVTSYKVHHMSLFFFFFVCMYVCVFISPSANKTRIFCR